MADYNGALFPSRLERARRDATPCCRGSSPLRASSIELLLNDGDRHGTRIDYHCGLRYPHRERIADRHDLLGSMVLEPKS